jgi:sugar (pentulose or hexulose) kinase
LIDPRPSRYNDPWKLSKENAMPIVLGTDLGTTTLTVLALDTATGEILAGWTAANTAEITTAADKSRGFSEWDARRIGEQACAGLRAVADQLGQRREQIAAIGITGQQHGVVLVDEALTPRTPFINWQDRRGEQLDHGSGSTYVARALELVGAEASRRTGCRLAAGYQGVTLFWLKETGALPAGVTACFLMDYFAALLTSRPPATDATCAASSGLFNLAAGDWDTASITALGLSRSLFPPVLLSGEPLGGLSPALAELTGLPAGVPVCVGIGDNQASFLGSVAERNATVLVNVGTGGQVTAYTEQLYCDALLETRPFPRGGYLLVCAGLCGGRAYAVLERFFREVGVQLFGLTPGEALYAVMNRLAGQVPRGADGMRCEPFFTGTRACPEQRAAWSGISAENFTPAHLTRALLEGMARAFRTGYESIQRHSGSARRRLVGAGNGLRENPLLARLVAEEFGLALELPPHREEAAYGAALGAAIGTGLVPDFAAAGRLIRYAQPAGEELGSACASLAGPDWFSRP